MYSLVYVYVMCQKIYNDPEKRIHHITVSGPRKRIFTPLSLSLSLSLCLHLETCMLCCDVKDSRPVQICTFCICVKSTELSQQSRCSHFNPNKLSSRYYIVSQQSLVLAKATSLNRSKHHCFFFSSAIVIDRIHARVHTPRECLQYIISHPGGRAGRQQCQVYNGRNSVRFSLCVLHCCCCCCCWMARTGLVRPCKQRRGFVKSVHNILDLFYYA